MSAIQYGQTATARPAAPQRPGVLNGGLIAAIGAGSASLVGAIAVYAGGEEMVRSIGDDYIRAEMGVSDTTLDVAKELGGDLYDLAIQQGYEALLARAGVSVFLGICLLLFGLLARNAATWARVLLTISAVVALPFQLLLIADLGPVTLKVGGAVTLLGCLVLLVLFWLPAVNRYGKAVA